jgi:hypothetical protein
MRRNADQSIAELMRIKTEKKISGPGKSAEEVVNRLWKMAMNGELLSPSGWNRASGFFTHPGPASENKGFMVMGNDWAVFTRTLGNDIKIAVGYSDAGTIDTALRYRPPKPSEFFKTEIWYSVVPVSAHEAGDRPELETAGNDTPVSSGWQIDGPPPKFPEMPWTTVNTAVRYVLEMRGKTTDPVVKKNADRTLAELLRYR